MSRTFFAVAAALTLAITTSLPAPASAQGDVDPDTRATVARFLDMERVGDPRISPDGSRVVFTRSHVDKMQDTWTSEIWMMNADGTRKRFLLEGGSPRWSPDGSRIAYVTEGDDGSAEIFVRWMDAEGAVSQVTRVEEAPSSLSWSPDGTQIAFIGFVPEPTDWSVQLPPRPEGAQWTAEPRIIDNVHFRQDYQGFKEEGAHQLFVVPADGGTPRQLTEGPGKIGAPVIGLHFGAGLDWTPDGGTIVFDGLLSEDWETRYMESYIYAVDVATGEVRQIVDEKGPWSAPTVSPDGRQVAFIGFPWTTQTYRASDLHVVGIDGSGMRKISAELDRDPGQLNWADDGSGVYFTAGDRGTRNVHFASTEGEVRQVTQGSHMLSLTSVSDDGTAVGTRTDPHKPGDVVRFALGEPGRINQLTDVNADILAGVELGDVEEIWYRSSGDTDVQGWIVKPPDFDPTRAYPLILHIHGGPHGMYNVGFNYAYQNFAAHGYVVLYTNPRGSTGYGTDFGNAIDNGYPSVDYDDLMAGVDAVIEDGYIDTENIFVTGCSGGGVLTAWVISHTDRFRAAGVRCPVINWMSFAGTADIVQWGYHRYEGYPWDNPDKYLEHSPLMYVEQVSTPALIMTGELDLRTPMSQSEEYYQALKAVGVPTRLMRFQDEFHGTSTKPSNFMRTQLYLMKWFEEWGTHDERRMAM